MRPDRWPIALAAAGVAATAAVAIWGCVVVPDARLRFVLVAVLLPALWAYVELARSAATTRRSETRSCACTASASRGPA